MTKTQLLSAAVAAALLLGSGAMVATAQDSATAENTRITAPERDGEHRVNHRRGGGKHGRHGGMFGGRGGSEMFAALFRQVDADGDGAVTQEEIDAFRSAKVGEADTSGDGALSIEEFDTLYREFTRSRMVDAFQKLDSDGDGMISAEELDVRFGDVVDRMDRNDDGALTLQRGRN